MVFLATSAKAPIPKPKARPAEGKRKTNNISLQENNHNRALTYEENVRMVDTFFDTLEWISGVWREQQLLKQLCTMRLCVPVININN